MKAAALIKSHSFNGTSIAVYAANKGEGLDWHHHEFSHLCDVRVGRVRCETADGKSAEVGPYDKAVSFRAIVKHRIVALDDGTEFENIFPA